MMQQNTSSPQSATGTTGPAAVSKAAVGPLTIRDLAVLGSVVIIFIASVLPIVQTLVGSLNLWNTGSVFYIGIGVILPLAVGGLFLARRLSPESKVRIGSLSTDQFASVVAAFATFFFLTSTVTNFGTAYLVGLIGSLLLLTATVCARWIPALASDFAGRPDVPAHSVARDAVPAHKRPATPKPVAANAGAPGAMGQQGPGHGAQYNPGQGAPAQVAPANQGGTNTPAAWATSQADAGHLAAGQIFTQGKDAASGPQGTGVAAASPAAAGTAHGGSAPQSPQASEGGAGSPQARTAQGATAQPPVADAKPAAAAPAATAPAAEAARGAVAPAAVAPSQDANATTLNPQVAPAKEEPAKAAEPAKESIAATVNPKPATPVIAEPFWFAVDRPQNVIDPRTRQFVFKLMPGAWILALEDRGNSFLVQDSHGKTGVLLDLVGIERASDSQ